MLAYPNTFPFDAGQLIINALLNRSTAKLSELAHAGWEVQGFVQGQLFGGGPPPVVFGDSDALMGRVELAHELETCGSSTIQAAAGLPWAKLLKALLTLLPLILAEAGG